MQFEYYYAHRSNLFLMLLYYNFFLILCVIICFKIIVGIYDMNLIIAKLPKGVIVTHFFSFYLLI